MPRTVSAFLSDSALIRLSQTKDSVQEESLISAFSVNSDSWKLMERKIETINGVKTRGFKKGHVILITITWKAVPIWSASRKEWDLFAFWSGLLSGFPDSDIHLLTPHFYAHMW